MKRKLDYSPVTGITTYVDYDHATKVSTVIEEQDCTQILENNKTLIADNHDRTKDGIKRSWLHLGSIPANVIQQMSIDTGLDPYSREGIDYLVKMIHQREFKLLKVANGTFL